MTRRVWLVTDDADHLTAWDSERAAKRACEARAKREKWPYPTWGRLGDATEAQVYRSADKAHALTLWSEIVRGE